MSEKRNDLPCAAVMDLLPLYHDGVVSDETNKMIKSHLADCEDCRHELESICSDDAVEEQLLEKDKPKSFDDFRSGVRALRRNGTLMGIVIASVIAFAFIGCLAFLNNEAILKVNADDLKIDDVIRYDLGENGSEGFLFSYTMDWSGGQSVTHDYKEKTKHLDIKVKRTVLGGRHEEDCRECFVVDDFYKDSFDIKEVEEIAVNGKIIWKKENGVNSNPPKYVEELQKLEGIGALEERAAADTPVSTDIITDKWISVTYADGHGIRWDKAGNVIAKYQKDEDGEIISLESFPGKS